MVRGTAGGQQADHGIDDRLLIDLVPQRRPLVTQAGELENALRSRLGQGSTQRAVRRHEGRAGQMQAHHLDHELVRARGSIERAGARPVVTRGLGIEQRLAV